MDGRPDTNLYLMLGEMRGQLAAIKEDTGDTRAQITAISDRVTALENAQLISRTRLGVLSTVWGALGGSAITIILRKLGLI